MALRFQAIALAKLNQGGVPYARPMHIFSLSLLAPLNIP